MAEKVDRGSSQLVDGDRKAQKNKEGRRDWEDNL